MNAPRTGPALLAFGATWCAPWLLLQPALDDLERRSVTVVRVDVDADVAAAEKWRVVTLPTFVLTVDGMERRRLTGAISHAELRRALEAASKRRKK